MLYQNTNTGAFSLTIFDVRAAMPNSSIPDDVAEVGDFKAYKEASPPFTPYNKELVEVAPVGGVQQWSLVDASADEIKQRTDNQAANIRYKRNELLTACDWTQILNGSPLTLNKTNEWAAYRDLLRNITEQTGFPWNVTWPSEPLPDVPPQSEASDTPVE